MLNWQTEPELQSELIKSIISVKLYRTTYKLHLIHAHQKYIGFKKRYWKALATLWTSNRKTLYKSIMKCNTSSLCILLLISRLDLISSANNFMENRLVPQLAFCCFSSVNFLAQKDKLQSQSQLQWTHWSGHGTQRTAKNKMQKGRAIYPNSNR